MDGPDPKSRLICFLCDLVSLTPPGAELLGFPANRSCPVAAQARLPELFDKSKIILDMESIRAAG
jgi:hypothetical protein